jgi:hypothetical protein
VTATILPASINRSCSAWAFESRDSPGVPGRQQHLAQVHPRYHGYDGDTATAMPGDGAVGPCRCSRSPPADSTSTTDRSGQEWKSIEILRGLSHWAACSVSATR